MNVKRIDHINLRTPLLEETLAFYERLLGMRRGPALAMVDQERNAWLYDEAGNALIHVNMPDPGETLLRDDDSGRLHHVAFECVRPPEVAARIAEMGLDCVRRDIPEFDFVQLNVFDPNGVRLELNFRGAA
jgi:catechol 2,3-dioxygenase-like lactoylglutathione lyase family enzyme